MPTDLIKFAKKRAIVSFIVAAAVNALILYFALSKEAEIPLFALVAENWRHSLIGALMPRALVISILVTFVTVWLTLKKHSKDEMGYIPWFRITLITALVRAVLAFIFVVGFALLLRAAYPTYAEISTSIVIPAVAVFAGVVAAYMTYAAVLTTESLLYPEE